MQTYIHIKYLVHLYNVQHAIVYHVMHDTTKGETADVQILSLQDSFHIKKRYVWYGINNDNNNCTKLNFRYGFGLQLLVTIDLKKRYFTLGQMSDSFKLSTYIWEQKTIHSFLHSSPKMYSLFTRRDDTRRSMFRQTSILKYVWPHYRRLKCSNIEQCLMKKL